MKTEWTFFPSPPPPLRFPVSIWFYTISMAKWPGVRSKPKLSMNYSWRIFSEMVSPMSLSKPFIFGRSFIKWDVQMSNIHLTYFKSMDKFESFCIIQFIKADWFSMDVKLAVYMCIHMYVDKCARTRDHFSTFDKFL